MDPETLRFRFIPPTEKQIHRDEIIRRIFWVILPFNFAGLVYYPVSPSPPRDWLMAFLVRLLMLSVAVTIFRLSLSNTPAQLEQSKYGFVDLTPHELRVSRSFHSLLRIEWQFLEKIEVKNSHLHLKYCEAVGGQIGNFSLLSLDVISLKEVENSAELIAELEKKLQLQGKSSDVLASCQTKIASIP